ncbi:MULTISPECIES: C40 family peptidase [Cyanophyceae]|uniref:C40 family peptidase n=1 Tax=Cyanophyceae TaxID=3028117 RepID=UPI0016868E41|nr:MULTISPECIES: C40 family peptidase [Cyanophyceae]MBD1918104.1 C40 family peptidase [Phormidium sp. FACHB-77]MBD2030136.1 C40 family peptidase [Phormidium sp. FACHB-322]MBD2051492.1 C40 family peptidase [Leptolyngbya sp. FACHB-60]
MDSSAAFSSQEALSASLGKEYVCGRALNLYKTDEFEGLVTQAAVGRHLRLVEASPQAYAVILCEDDYPGWISATDGDTLKLAEQPYQPVSLDRSAIELRLPEAIAFTQRAMATPNTYLWGGTVGPNYDCSGLMQAAFASVGIRLPRDSYQQEAFTQPISWDELLPGDLIFFGTPERTKHVALYLGQGNYIHSSGVDQGRNGIGIDSLTDLSHPVSAAYHRQLRRAGRVMTSYCSGVAV